MFRGKKTNEAENMADRIRLMTHNVWNRDVNSPHWEKNGADCSAEVRLQGLLRVYRETLPDIIGGQEVSVLMADLLKEALQEEPLKYTLIWGRYTPILFRADKLDLIDTEFCTYPQSIPGFEGAFNDARSKAFHLGVFRVKETGKTFIFVTTHLWWMLPPPDESYIGEKGYQAGSDEAREQQIAMAVEKIKEYREKYRCPAVLVGDMNTGYNSKAMRYVRQQGFRHARDIATEYADETVGYHYCFFDGYKTQYDDDPFEAAIDHIYVLGEKEGAVKRFERYSPEYYYPISDHSPAYIDIEL